MLLFALVIIVAIIGGFLGDLLEFAAWVIAIFAIIGAIIGFFLYRGFQKLKENFTAR